MKVSLAVAAFLTALYSLSTVTSLQAQTVPSSSLTLLHPSLAPGATQAFTVTARDLDGHPLVGASVTASVAYGATTVRYTLKRTDRSGLSTLRFSAPAHVVATRAVVSVRVTSGLLSIPLSGSFLLVRAGTQTRAPTAVRTAVPRTPVPARPTATPTSTPRVTSSALGVAVRVIPNVVASGAPLWVVVDARDGHGTPSANGAVDVALVLGNKTVRLTGQVAADGVATIATTAPKVSSDTAVSVGVLVRWHGLVGSGAAQLVVSRAVATATNTATPIPTATATPLPTATPPPSPTPIPSSTPTALPTAVPTATSTPLPTPTTAPTFTPVPTFTATAIPTFTPLPTATLVPVNCPGSMAGCEQAMLNILNATRAQYGIAPLSLNATESAGTATCPGAYGHSEHMSKLGGISHDQFPADICVQYATAGENVGMMGVGNELSDLQGMHSLMMSEPHVPGCTGNHACNILDAHYSQVGIGLYTDAAGATWLTEDFIG